MSFENVVRMKRKIIRKSCEDQDRKKSNTHILNSDNNYDIVKHIFIHILMGCYEYSDDHWIPLSHILCSFFISSLIEISSTLLTVVKCFQMTFKGLLFFFLLIRLLLIFISSLIVDVVAVDFGSYSSQLCKKVI